MLRLIIRTIPLSFINLLRLFLFVVCLLPGFVRFAWYYFIASDRSSLHYGNESIRQRIDVYRSGVRSVDGQRQAEIVGGVSATAEECQSNAPVAVFCTGGGWMIGYKMWGALLARSLTAAGVVVVIPDMRNYPSVYIPDMVNDVDLAIDWTVKNIAQYGGDPTNIVVIGQSAGGHIACMAIFRTIQRKIARESLDGLTGTKRKGRRKTVSQDERWQTGWSASDLRGFAAISAPLSLGSAITHSFRHKGFDDNMVDRMFGFETDKYDPFLVLKNFQREGLKQKFMQELPPISIYQGTEDKTVPYEVSETFYRELLKTTSGENSVSFVPYIGWGHTDPILEGPMDGDHRLHEDLFDDINKWTSSPNLTWPTDSRANDRLCPRFMVELGRITNPF